MDPTQARAFATAADLEHWLKQHHATARELWVRVFKKGSGTHSVDWNDCVLAALAWGWIDGQRKACDDASFFQRLTPRRPKSNWSKKNTEHVERLIAQGRMQPPGLVLVDAARSDGRWDAAYAGSADMVLPAEFLTELQHNPTAAQFFETLDSQNRFAIYHRLHIIKRADTRTKRIAQMVAQLARGERFH